jgi:hypothetical protein
MQVQANATQKKKGGLLTKNYSELLIPCLTILSAIIQILFMSAAIGTVILPLMVGLLFFGTALAKVQIEKKEAKVVDVLIKEQNNNQIEKESNSPKVTKQQTTEAELENLNENYKTYQLIYNLVSLISFLALTVPAIFAVFSGGGLLFPILYIAIDILNVSRVKQYHKEFFDEEHKPLVNTLTLKQQDNFSTNLTQTNEQKAHKNTITAQQYNIHPTMIQKAIKILKPALLTSKNFRQRTIDKILFYKSTQQNIRT